MFVPESKKEEETEQRKKKRKVEETVGDESDDIAQFYGSLCGLESLEHVENELKRSGASYCEMCECFFENEKDHNGSVVHLLRQNEVTRKPRRHFLIPSGNTGFRLLVKNGWNEENGLGKNSDGRLYPIQTVLKRDKKGLGGDKGKEKRITHKEKPRKVVASSAGDESGKMRKNKEKEKLKRLREEIMQPWRDKQHI